MIINLIFYIFIFLLLYKIILYKKITKNNNIKKTITIIISRYNEDLKWTLEEPFNQFKYIVYNKGTNNNFEKKNIDKIYSLNNVGKIDHTILYHIVNNYNNLTDIIVFFPGSLNMFSKKNFCKKILYNIINYNQAYIISSYVYNVKNFFYYTKLYKYTSAFKDNQITDKMLLSDIRPFGKWYEKYFNYNVHNITWGAMFSIDKRDVLNHSKDWYIQFLKQIETDINPEIGHYIEKSWFAIFNPIKYTFIENNNLLYFLNSIFISLLQSF